MKNMKGVAESFLGEIYSRYFFRLGFFFISFFGIFSAVYLSLDKFFVLDDHFFHIRFADIFKERGIEAFFDFKWLYFSKIAQGDFFVYYNFLFYIFLIPFTFISPLFLGIKFAGITLFTLALTIVYGILSKLGERKSVLWIIFLLAVSQGAFIQRFLSSRPFVLSPVLLLLLLYLLYKKNYLASFFVSLGYFFWHGATFFFPFLIALVFFLFSNLYSKKYDWRILIYTFLGVALSFALTLAIFPGFFGYISNVFLIYKETILGGVVNINEGNELYPFEFFDYFRQNFLFVSLFIFATFFEIWHYLKSKRDGRLFCEDLISSKKQAFKGTLFFLSSAFFLGMFLISKRYGDYFFFFSLIYLPISLNMMLESISFKNILVKSSVISGSFIVVIYLFLANMLFIHTDLSLTGEYRDIQESSEWVRENVPKGEVVFHPTWNWFTRLFYYDPDHYYIAGLEPRYFYEYNPELFWIWRNISDKALVCNKESCPELENDRAIALTREESKKMWYNKNGNAIADVIKYKFNSEYVISGAEFVLFEEALKNNSRFEKVFEDEVYGRFSVYKVN